MLCAYGCGKEAIHQLKNGKFCCSEKWNSCPTSKNKFKICKTDYKLSKHAKRKLKNKHKLTIDLIKKRYPLFTKIEEHMF